MVKAVLSLKDMLAALDSIPAFTEGFVDGGQDSGTDQ